MKRGKPKMKAPSRRVREAIPALVVAAQKARGFRPQLPGARRLHPRGFDKNQLIRGTVHELEHTTDPAIAMEIAMRHLAERRDYYRVLERAVGNPVMKANPNKDGLVVISKDLAKQMDLFGEDGSQLKAAAKIALEREPVDPKRLELASAELREMEQTFKDRRLARMAKNLRIYIDQAVLETQIGLRPGGVAKSAKGNPAPSSPAKAKPKVARAKPPADKAKRCRAIMSSFMRGC